MIALSSSATLLKVPRRMRFSVILAKKRSTMLSHDDEPYLIERAYVLFSQVGIAAAARSGQGLVAGRSHKPDMARDPTSGGECYLGSDARTTCVSMPPSRAGRGTGAPSVLRPYPDSRPAERPPRGLVAARAGSV